jgi:D-sedoheptulose 7-phosphate isomerase
VIKLIVLDIDGVITDGAIIINENGGEEKKINLKNIDAIYELKRRGYKLAGITSENTPIVRYFKKRFPWDLFYVGKNNKLNTIKEIEKNLNIKKEEICYIGDGIKDIETLKYVGLSVCPQDAIDEVRLCSDIVLEKKSGEGCLWEFLNILENYNKSPFSLFFYRKIFQHIDIFKKITSDSNLISIIKDVGDTIINVLMGNGKIFLCGNGGSAADAQHLAAEFVSSFFKKNNGLNAEALTANTSILTAIGNDYSYEKLFVKQLSAKASENDMLIGISTSGKSKNIIEALKFSKQIGMKTVLLTGNSKIADSSFIDYTISIPSTIVPRIQEAHIFIGHLITEYVETNI